MISGSSSLVVLCETMLIVGIGEVGEGMTICSDMNSMSVSVGSDIIKYLVILATMLVAELVSVILIIHEFWRRSSR